MDKTIKAGDLVMVTKPRLCCKLHGHIGKVFRVESVETSPVACQNCGKIYFGMSVSYGRNAYGSKLVIELPRLTKINPLLTSKKEQKIERRAER